MSKTKANQTTQGCLITFEGGEGGGKTTQSQRLKTKLEEAGLKVLSVREPGGTEISEKIRNLVLSKKHTQMADTTEALLFQAARAQIYHQKVIPALKDGAIVIMDRSADSSVVYQGMVRGFGTQIIGSLNMFSTQGTTPSLTFLLDVPTKVGLGRKDDQEVNRFELEGLSFGRKVRQAYLDLARDDASSRWVIVDASQSESQVFEEVWQTVVDQSRRLLGTSL